MQEWYPVFGGAIGGAIGGALGGVFGIILGAWLGQTCGVWLSRDVNSEGELTGNEASLDQSLVMLAVLVAFVSFASAFLLREWISGVALMVAAAGVTVLFVRKAWIDNTLTVFESPHLLKALAATSVLFAPVALVVWLGLAVGFYVDGAIDQALQWSQERISRQVQSHSDSVNAEIEKPLSWWNPVDWVRGSIKRKVLGTYKSSVVEPVSFGVRASYAILCMILRLTQYMSYASMTFLSIRAFVFLFLRACLYAGATVRFKLPHAA